jgi:RNA polymerase sigma-70 factor (ECF subfamily)
MQAYERYGRALIRKAERILRNKEDARDVVHALFVDMLQKNEPEPDLPYLYRAVTHRCLSLLRDEKNRARLLAENDTMLAPVRTRCEERAIDMDLLMKFTGKLDESTLEILVYRFLDDLTQDEIASMVGLSRKTIGKRLDAIREAVALLEKGSES